ncbi:MAG TPA: hypothetical protein ENJ87_11790 [Gammaproteobacteria bacterium]|nr:hypothetical protein [Gammaproteobacteria bacterium]
MKFIHSLYLISITLLLSACTPHPASGVWKTKQDNDYGLAQLIVAFDGKANFATTKPDDAEWHCFWSGTSKKTIILKCTPSTDTGREEQFTLTVDDKGIAEFHHETELIALLRRLNKNPLSE